MQSVFSRCGFLSACDRFFGAYWHFLSVETVCKLFKMFLQQMGNRITILGSIKHPTPGMAKTYSCCILTPMPWAHLHPTISPGPSLKRKRIILCYSFILSKLVYQFTMVTLQKHHYTNNPTTKNTFIIAHVAILMARKVISMCGITRQTTIITLNKMIKVHHHFRRIPLQNLYLFINIEKLYTNSNVFEGNIPIAVYTLCHKF